MTGATPEAHGIVSNTTFDPLYVNREGWYWYAEDIRVPTLWQAASAAGLSTAAINWPVTVGDRNIRWLLPEFWRASTPEDRKLVRQLDRPEDLTESLEARLGPFVDGYADTPDADRIRTRFATAILREHKPQFTAVHLVALDGVEHREGPYVAPVYATLEEIDRMVGDLGAAALANDPATVVAIVSDHGFIATHTAVNLRTQFVETGLIRLKQPLDPNVTPSIESWDAQLWPGGASAAVVLREPANHGVRERVARLLAQLQAAPRNGIAQVIDLQARRETGGFPDAAFLIEFAPGFYLGSALRGELLSPATSKGTHGYLPQRPEMHAAFFLRGAGIESGRNLGVIDMRQIAPTLADILEVKLSGVDAKALPVRAASKVKEVE